MKNLRMKKLTYLTAGILLLNYDKNHPAVFPEELCRRILKYYSFENDVVLDPFAGSGTLGRVARRMNRIPVMCEINNNYIEIIDGEVPGYYDVRGRNYKKNCQQINLWERL